MHIFDVLQHLGTTPEADQEVVFYVDTIHYLLQRILLLQGGLIRDGTSAMIYHEIVRACEVRYDAFGDEIPKSEGVEFFVGMSALGYFSDEWVSTRRGRELIQRGWEICRSRPVLPIARPLTGLELLGFLPESAVEELGFR
jgi:hypothetical protein